MGSCEVGQALVHTDGVDFHGLEPTSLAIGGLAIRAVYKTVPALRDPRLARMIAKSKRNSSRRHR